MLQWWMLLPYFIVGFIFAYISHRKDWTLIDDITPLEYFIFFAWPLVASLYIVIGGIALIGIGFYEGTQWIFKFLDASIEGIKRFIRKKKTPQMDYKYENYD